MYTAKAYVKISRESAPNLTLELCRLDYKNSAYHPSDIFWFIEDGYFYSREYTTELEEGVFVDCNAHTPNGTEEEAVRLFLELAQMMDNDYYNLHDCEFYYIDNGEVKYHNYGEFLPDEYDYCTPLEVAEAFKEGRIEL